VDEKRGGVLGGGAGVGGCGVKGAGGALCGGGGGGLLGFKFFCETLFVCKYSLRCQFRIVCV